MSGQKNQEGGVDSLSITVSSFLARHRLVIPNGKTELIVGAYVHHNDGDDNHDQT